MTLPSASASVGARLFATIGLTAAVGGAVGTIVVRYLAPAPFIPVAFGFGGAAMVGFVIEGLSWASIGALLVVRRPGNAVGWLMVLVGVGNALSMLTTAMTFAFVADGTAQGERLAQFAGWATVLLQLVGIFQFAIGFVFPSGRVQGRGWAWFMRIYWALAIVFALISLSQPGPLQLVPTVQNPFGFGPDLRGDGQLAPVLSLFAVIVFPSLAISMVSRYRAAGSVERQQFKWFVLALGLSAITLSIVFWVAIVMNRPVDSIGLAVYAFAGAVVPVAIGIAILRHHLYDIDRIISRTVAYACVSAILALVFGGAIVLMSTALASFAQGPTIAVAASTLLAFAVFQPARRRIQSAVDRRFDRARYDGERTASAFSVRMREATDLPTVAHDLDVTVRRAIAPSSVGLWLRGGGR